MIECFKTFRDTTDSNHFISRNYVIPSIATFSSHLHGIKLGYFLNRAREAYHANHLTTFQIKALEKYQIHWDSESYRLNFLTLPSLDMYKKTYGDTKVSQAFTVPFTQTWPDDLWGVKLGIQLNNWIFKKDTLSLHVVRALNERAFAWDIFEEDFRTIVIALKTFGELKGNLLVPHSFQVPATS